VGETETRIYQALVIRRALILYADTGIKANRSYTPGNMMRVACRDCFEGPIIGVPGDMCDECVAAGCEVGEHECRAPSAYGGMEDNDNG